MTTVMTEALPEEKDILPSGLTDAFRYLRDVPIFHFLEVAKVNRRGRRQRRFLVLTSTHLYSCVENGTIQRCVSVRAIDSVHVWLGAAPCVGLKVPAEYDLLLRLASAGAASALSAALRCACGRDAVVRSEPPGAAEFRLERPRGFARTMASRVQWTIGTAGACPDGAARPFVAGGNGAAGIRLPQRTAQKKTEAEAPAAAVPLHDEMLDASHAMHGSGEDYSDEDERQTAGTADSRSEARRMSVGSVDVPMPARAAEVNGQATEDALREERRRRAEEHEQWCALIAAERKNAHQLRETIAELRSQVLALTAKNITLRSHLITKPRIHNPVNEGPK